MANMLLHKHLAFPSALHMRDLLPPAPEQLYLQPRAGLKQPSVGSSTELSEFECQHFSFASFALHS